MCKVTSDLMLPSGANLQRDLAETSCKPLQMLEEGQGCPAPRQVQGLTGIYRPPAVGQSFFSTGSYTASS